MSELEQTTAPRRKPKRSATSPTKRTLAECRKRGWTAQVVEHRVPRINILRDLFGVIDIVALTPRIHDKTGGDILGIQATSGLTGGNHSVRRAKILAEPRARQWVEAGGRLELWSWAKQGARGKRKTWTLRVEVFTGESWARENASERIGG